MFTLSIIDSLLKNSTQQFQELQDIYKKIPATNCKRRASCCSNLSEMTLIEALSVIQQIINMSTDRRVMLTKKIIKYSFLNPVELIKCPFLIDKDCLIYQYRSFGCRAYGLWSKDFSEKISNVNRQADLVAKQEWENFGIILPATHTDTKIAYCTDVKTIDNVQINDAKLLSVGLEISELSQQILHWHSVFKENYFSDISFFLSSLIFGDNESLNLKFMVVSDFVKSDNKPKRCIKNCDF